MTRRSSLRAQAQRIYRERVKASTPTPNPSPQGGGEPAAASGQPTRLTARVRRLYEESAVPVAEIARLAGVTERTIYKYARKGRWRPRYAWTGDGARPASRPARGRWSALRQLERAQRFAPVKGAGGRFVRRDDEGKPYARGLKATDPQAERRAAAQCRQAERLARAAQAEAQTRQRFEGRLFALKWMSRALRELVDYRAQRAKDLRGRPAPADDAVERGYRFALESATENWHALK